MVAELIRGTESRRRENLGAEGAEGSGSRSDACMEVTVTLSNSVVMSKIKLTN